MHRARGASHRGTDSWQYRCRSRYLADEFDVPWGARLDAFRIVRDECFDAAVKKRFHVQSSEIHILYTTAVVLFVGHLFVWFAENPGAVRNEMLVRPFLLSVGAAVFTLAGLIGDIFVCRQVCTHLKRIDPSEVRDVLSSM